MINVRPNINEIENTGENKNLQSSSWFFEKIHVGGIVKNKRENAQVTSIRRETEAIAIVPTDVKKIKIYNFMPMNLKIKEKIPRKKTYPKCRYQRKCIHHFKSSHKKTSDPDAFISKFFWTFREDKTPIKKERTLPNSFCQHQLSAKAWRGC